MTTILEINPAVVNIVQKMPDVGLLVVGDRKTNHSEWDAFSYTYENVFYISPARQRDFSIVNVIPWNHFGRKSIGYIIAISRGAKIIYDFDDDNHFNFNSLNTFKTMRVHPIQTRHAFFNPYPYFYAEEKNGLSTFLWPRGQPLQWINDPATHTVQHINEHINLDEVAVIQSLANNDPDVDAIYRMTRPLPVKFKKKKRIVVPPRSVFSPWNAQAVIVKEPAFFGLLLPISVTGRVSDIWRSYITTRLLWETDYRIGFSSPVVTQFRNPHSYMKDFKDEHDLYYKVDELLEILSNWVSYGLQTLDEAYINLVELLVEKNILGETDIILAKAWVSDLKLLGYKWPAITTRLPSFTVPTEQIIDRRNTYNPIVS